MARHSLAASDGLIDLLFSTNYFVCRYPPLLPASSRPFPYSELPVHDAAAGWDWAGCAERKKNMPRPLFFLGKVGLMRRGKGQKKRKAKRYIRYLPYLGKVGS